MEIEKLKSNISKKEEKIEKINKKIDKLSKNLTPEEVDLAKSTAKLGYYQFVRETKDIPNQLEISDLRSAYIDLEENSLTLQKYKNMLNFENEKVNRLSQEKISVIWDFLLKWKEKVKEDVRANVPYLEKAYKLNSEYCDLHNNRYHYIEEMGEADYKKKVAEVKEAEKRAKAMVDPLLTVVAQIDHGPEVEDDYYGTNRRKNLKVVINEDKLEEILSKDCDNKYLKMIDQVTESVGNITDASGLSIGRKGELNGIIVGDKGKAKIETVGAGGYNMDEIVNVKHGQVYHFRTLIHKVK